MRGVDRAAPAGALLICLMCALVCSRSFYFLPFGIGEWFSKNSRFAVLSHIRESTDTNSVVLAFRQYEVAYYGNRKQVCSLDPRMVPVYRLDEPDRVQTQLHGLGITHIYVPPYACPTIENTQLLTVISDTSAVSLIMESEGYRLYRFNYGTDTLSCRR